MTGTGVHISGATMIRSDIRSDIRSNLRSDFEKGRTERLKQLRRKFKLLPGEQKARYNKQADQGLNSGSSNQRHFYKN